MEQNQKRKNYLNVKSTKKFDKSLKKIAKQGKDIRKLQIVIEKLSKREKLGTQYNNHKLKDDIKIVMNVILNQIYC